MRTLRLSVAGTVILALLGGLGSAALAQDDEETGSATYITGSWTWTHHTDDGAVYEVEMSDSRASGTLTESSISWQEYGDTTPPTVANVVGIELANEEGSWSGFGSGVYDPAMGWRLAGYQAGEGAYEGLTLYIHGTRDIYSTPVMPLEGVIFEGPVPTMLDAVEPSAE